MQWHKIYFVVLVTEVMIFTGQCFGLTLSENGQTPYWIVVAGDATESEKTAAGELQKYLKLVTGAEFPIQSSADVSGPSIRVGFSEKNKSLVPDIDWNALGTEGIVIKTIGDDVLLAGGRPRGTLYAVYTFLEDIVGVRWWTSAKQFIPRKPTLQIDKLNTVYCPRFEYRMIHYYDILKNPQFASKMKVNGLKSIASEDGGHYSILGFCHTFNQLLPPKKYFSKHPEWYSLVNGQRTSKRAQLCLTNVAVRKELTKNALEWIRKNPNAEMISISQNDCAGWCECEKCKALEKKEGSPSGPLLHFVNQVAGDIAKEFPNIKVETLAYERGRMSPKHLKPSPNVVIRLCSIECMLNKPLTDPVNIKFNKDIIRWSKICPKLFVWDYVTNFSNPMIPLLNIGVLAPNIRFFAENNVSGIFEQGDSFSAAGDFVGLRVWLIAHLLWNPQQDENKLIKEYLEGYYGSAAPYLSSYLELIWNSASADDLRMGCFSPNYSYLSLDEMNQATRLLTNAKKAVADHPELALRVEKEHLPINHLWLLRYRWLKQEADAKKSVFLGPKDPVAACEKFISDFHRFGAKDGRYTNSASLNVAYENYLRGLVSSASSDRASWTVPAECKGMALTDWVDIQDREFRCIGKGRKTIDDPGASDGKALNISGNIKTWAVRYMLADAISCRPKVNHCYISVRCDAKAKNGLAYSVGIYDNGKHRNVVTKNVMLKEIGGGAYHSCDLGVNRLDKNMLLWIAPSGDSNSVKSISVDRMFLIPSPASRAKSLSNKEE